jgi:hypothetical protein
MTNEYHFCYSNINRFTRCSNSITVIFSENGCFKVAYFYPKLLPLFVRNLLLLRFCLQWHNLLWYEWHSYPGIDGTSWDGLSRLSLKFRLCVRAFYCNYHKYLCFIIIAGQISFWIIYCKFLP